jgi:hypothetical protein
MKALPTLRDWPTMNKIGAVLLQHLQALEMVCWKPSQGCAGLAMTGGAQASLADIRVRNQLRSSKSVAAAFCA